jgi:hypothetical protein
MKSIIFVYNADSNLASAMLDVGRRILTPKKYPCTLCKITYGPFGMKQDWKAFTKSLPFESSFLHKDELPKDILNLNLSFPAVLLVNSTGPKNKVKTLTSSKAFSKIEDL